MNHRVPTDVTQEDLEFYFNVWIFMNFEDLLFYLYPVADLNGKHQREDRDKYVYNTSYVDNHLHVVEYRLSDPQTRLQPSDRQGLIEGLKWIKESVHPDEDWSHFPAIRRTIGLGD